MATTESEGLSVADELLCLYDELTEFRDCCAFLCDAFCNLAAEENALDATTVEGMKCFAHWMKTRITQVKGQLKLIHERGHPPVCNRAFRLTDLITPPPHP